MEVHPAETGSVRDIERKLAWVLEFLGREAQAELNSLPRQFHWVASGRINIPKHVPQYEKLQSTLRAKGLLGPVLTLDLP